MHYDLTLYPNFYGDAAEFYGNVTIEIDVKQATRYLLVHIKRLNTKGMNLQAHDVLCYMVVPWYVSLFELFNSDDISSNGFQGAEKVADHKD